MGASDTSSTFEKRINTIFLEVVSTLQDSLQQDAGFLDNLKQRVLADTHCRYGLADMSLRK